MEHGACPGLSLPRGRNDLIRKNDLMARAEARDITRGFT